MRQVFRNQPHGNHRNRRIRRRRQRQTCIRGSSGTVVCSAKKFPEPTHLEFPEPSHAARENFRSQFKLNFRNRRLQCEKVSGTNSFGISGTVACSPQKFPEPAQVEFPETPFAVRKTFRNQPIWDFRNRHMQRAKISGAIPS